MINKEAIEKIKKEGASLGLKKSSSKGTLVVLRNVQIVFVRLAEPYVSDDGKAVFSVTPMIPKSNKKMIEDIMSAIKMTLEKSELFNPAQKKALAAKVLKIHAEGSLLKDGDKTLDKNTGKPYTGLAGHLILQVKANGEKVEEGIFKPRFELTYIRAKDKTTIRKHEIADELYSGAWVDIQCQLTPYLHKTGGPSMPCYLQGVQKLLDDERIGGGNQFDDRQNEFSETDSTDFSTEGF